MLDINPYQAQAGPELDALIHEHVMRETIVPGKCPCYSTDTTLAKVVLAKLKTRGGMLFTIGRTELEGRTWFARSETNVMNGTEVFADTFALAICRLALLRLEETESKSRQTRK